jgi:excisionase family DNA binding protein
MLTSPPIVEAAFLQLEGAIDAEIAELQKIGGEVFHDCSPKQARGLLERSKELAALKEQIARLRSQWASGASIRFSGQPAQKLEKPIPEPTNPILIRHIKGVSVPDVAKSLGVNEGQVREWLELGKLKGYRPTGGRWKVTLADMRRFISKHPELLKR